MAKSLKKTKKTKKAVSSKPAKTANKKKTPSMGVAEMREFISFIAQTGLSEVDIEMGELKLHIKRQSDLPQPPLAVAAPLPLPAASLPPSREEQPPQTDTPTKNHIEINSPMIGTFYQSANPDTPPFISVGDKVKKGQVVCIVEAMKLFNEIESEVSGTVVKILAENASPVEYEQPLFLVDADE